MRILFVHEVSYLRKPIFEMHEFPEYLATRGQEVGFVHFPEGSNSKEIENLGGKRTVSGRVVPGSEIVLYTPSVFSGEILGRLIQVFTFGIQFRKIVLDFRPDIIVSFAVPTSGWQSLRVARDLGIPYVFRALDVSHKIRRGTFSALIRIAEKYIYRRADLVSANNPAMERYCAAMGAPRDKLLTHLPPLNLNHFANALGARNLVRGKLGVPLDARVCVYMGSFFYFSGLPEVIADFAENSESLDYLVLIGGGEQDSTLRTLVKSLGVDDRVLFTGFSTFEELPEWLSAADIAINPMRPSLVSNAAFPNKVIQYMATGLPVVSTRLEGLELTFGSTSGLLFVEEPSMVFSKCKELMNSDARLSELGAANLSLVADKFSQGQAVTKFLESLESLVGGKND